MDIYQQILDATEVLNNQRYKTPVICSEELNNLCNAEVYLKCENFQRGGSFKFRGAYYVISQLVANQKPEHIITYSTGNHGIAVALVCRMLKVPATIIIPNNVAKTTLSEISQYDAEIVLYDPLIEEREKVAEEVHKQKHGIILPPSNHLGILSGHATAALELLEDVANLDYLLVPCGGGGLLSGSAIATRMNQPSCRVIGIEPDAADDATRSFESGILHSVTNPQTIADGTRTRSLGEITFPLILKYVYGMRTVTEDEIIRAVNFLILHMKLVVEPSGALGLAALIGDKTPLSGRIGIIISGGNIDRKVLLEIVGAQN